MPNTPRVQFNFENNNVQNSTPLLGVSHVVAHTTKGPFNSPDKVFNTYSAFQEVYGEEIVPDGTVSNIQKAFELGSKLRISRVAGVGATLGSANIYTPGGEPVKGGEAIITFTLVDPTDKANTIAMKVGIKTKEAGSPILDATGYNLNRDFYLRVSKGNGPTNRITLTQFKTFTGTNNDQVAAENILASNLLFSGANYTAKGPNPTAFVEPQVLQDFVNNVPNIQLTFVEADATDETIASRIKTIEDVIATFRNYSNWYGTVKVGEAEVAANPLYMVINEGTSGSDPDVQSWINGFEAINTYNDGYQLILSHIHQHLPNYYMEALVTVADIVKSQYEIVLYVEVPKEDSTGNIQTPDNIIAALKTLEATVGYAKNIAYFGGGIKYYNENGALQNCDVLGTVLGLGDASASNYGPYMSFAGMNRGVVNDALGPVTENLGAPAKIDKLQELAEWFCNIFVVKDTPNQGKRTMLWHNFTSSPKSDSEKFLSIVRLNLYLKKSLRPILESYLEEPNNWTTWKKIYYQGKGILDDLIDVAITEYKWMGDQFANSYEDLQVNNETDVRQGKYRLVIKYKDIVPLQEVTVDIVIDAASQSIDLETQIQNL